MGIIQQQTLKGSILSYTGVALGFVTTGYLAPKFLSTEENGLIRLLVSYSVLFAQFGTLGFNQAMTRYFPYFRDKKQQHNGFPFIILAVSIVGFIVVMLLFFLLKPVIIGYTANRSDLFIDYIYYLVPLILFSLIFLMLDNYFKMLYNAIIGIALKEFFQRLFIILSLSAYCIGLLTFDQFIAFYVVSLCLPSILLIIVLIKKREFNLKPKLSFVSKGLARKMANISAFGFFTGFTLIAVLHIDGIMISSMIDIESTGIYSITMFFGTLIIIPARSLRKISSTVIADAWKSDNTQSIKSILKKSSINQFWLACLLFIGIWANIDNVFNIIGSDYEPGKYVIFFIALKLVIEMKSGVSGTIIRTSGKYKYSAYLSLILLLLVIVTNYIFIRQFGLVGGAIAAFVSFSVLNFIRYLILYRLFKMHPFSIKDIIIIIVSIGCYFLVNMIPAMNNFVVDIIVRIVLICTIFFSLSFVFQISEEFNKGVISVLKMAQKDK